MKNLEDPSLGGSHFAEVKINIGGAEVSLDEISKQKVQNRFDEDMFADENVQISCEHSHIDNSLIQIENMSSLSNQQKLEKLMRCNNIC